MIKFKIIKKNDDVEMYQNIDEFYKMRFKLMINDEIDNVDDVLQLSCDMSRLYTSYETFKQQLKRNNINDYIIVHDFYNEKCYVYDVETQNIFYVDMIDIFEFICDFKLYKIENINEKYNLMCLFFNVMLMD